MLIVITGASKGIGYELAKQLSQQPGNLIIAVSRNINSLLKLVREKNTHALLPLKADITKPLHRKKIYETIRSLDLSVNILINNAGEIVNKPFEKISEK